MADDASGSGDDGEEQPSSPTDPDGSRSTADQRTGSDDWDLTNDERDRTDHDRRRGDSENGENGGTDADDRAGIGAVDDTAAVDRDDEYRIPLDLSGGDADEGANTDGESDAGEEPQYGPEPSSTPVEPGNPSLEAAVFVILGAMAMMFVMVRLFGLVM
ncbi:DUF7312 domain-containing protein [Natronolimnohabitans innermongolicus]|uniref:DUF7312 domain-containing protein n=1 Tax=Natronolimnohabitans innermongolicus JCM 12255 TaxID=1227499 RepID=L9XBD3_9EURY|nr:hypothetical protein [Natronolimnohabitans innermongolicus]ELY59034.1 hypothetical protein C493_05270 [Natronolimnohabitans innermongolicus JCM 12255]